MLQSSYSRDTERAADGYSVDLMSRAGGDPRALGVMLTRIDGANHPGTDLVNDHPTTKERVAAINAAPRPASLKTLLGSDEWAALKRICG